MDLCFFAEWNILFWFIELSLSVKKITMKIVRFSYKAQSGYLFYKFFYGSYNVGVRRYA